jgi:hypothetical protein
MPRRKIWRHRVHGSFISNVADRFLNVLRAAVERLVEQPHNRAVGSVELLLERVDTRRRRRLRHSFAIAELEARCRRRRPTGAITLREIRAGASSSESRRDLNTDTFKQNILALT